MRKPLILLFALGLALLGGPLHAAAAKGHAAVIEALLGRVELNRAGKTSKPKLGQALRFGDTIVTGSNGRVSLRHADNAVTRMAPNTDLTLKAPGEKKGIFLGLKKGLVRFLVGKRKPGESFEVETANAVAAVKGTDGETETDGKNTRSAVFSSGRQKALELLSRETGKSVSIAPGQEAGLDDKGFQTRELSREDFERSDGQFQGLPTPGVEGGEGGEEGGEQGQGGPVPADEDASLSAIGDAISDAFADVMEDLGLDNLLLRDEQTGDLVAGRVAFDRFGERTQISSYVIRTDDTTITKATYSKREKGPFAGTSLAQEATVWNQALPQDWASVADRALDDPANLDSAGAPLFWREFQYFIASNPQGDVLEVTRDYQRPYFAYDYMNVSGLYRGALLPQGFSQRLDINDQAVHYFDWLADASAFVTENAAGAYVAYPPDTYDDWDSFSFDEADGSVRFEYSIFSSVFLETDVRLLAQDGTVVPLTDKVSEPAFLRDLKGFDNAYNLEVTFRSVYLSAPIDLLIIPEIFDAFDFYDLPVQSGGCGMC